MFDYFVNLLFPSKCMFCGAIVSDNGGNICGKCLSEINRIDFDAACRICGRPSETGQSCRSCASGTNRFIRNAALSYYYGKFQPVIFKYKYGGIKRYGKDFARLIYTGMFDGYISGLHADCFIPVPLYVGRMKSRGFNQAELIARNLSDLTGIPTVGNNLVRIRETKPQSRLNARERRINVDGAFRVSDPSALKGKRLLLIDDIFTTGATLDECAKILLSAGANAVFGLTLLVTDIETDKK